MAGSSAAFGLSGCDADAHALDAIAGRFVGVDVERGHLMREMTAAASSKSGKSGKSGNWPAPAITRRVQVLIAGGGIAGLAAARALRRAGVEDFALLELEDSTGGNSRGMEVGGIACPRGAHYLPVPGDDAPEVQDFLEELGLRKRVAGRWTYDELHLCHSPQERLFIDGRWQEGLLPSIDAAPVAALAPKALPPVPPPANFGSDPHVPPPLTANAAATLAQYRRFASRINALRHSEHFAIPVARSSFSPTQLALDAQTFVHGLDAEGFNDSKLRWYLDYCCHDDYGAGAQTVSAWAGVHYFASRHGFDAPGEADAEREPVLTWPQGNGFLADALAAPLQGRVQAARVVLRIEETKGGVEVLAWDAKAQRMERWLAQQCIVALPVFIAARVVARPFAPLQQAAAGLAWAPWLVANLRLDAPLQDRPGAAPSWDNVLYGAPGLGYVDARHQSLDPRPRPTVLTYYRALGDVANSRAQLLAQPWQSWRNAVLAELGTAHPDIVQRTQQIQMVRYGHAMAVPLPGNMNRIGLQRNSGVRHQLSSKEHVDAAELVRDGRLLFAHADWSGYSIFEEAFTRGDAAGAACAALAAAGSASRTAA